MNKTVDLIIQNRYTIGAIVGAGILLTLVNKSKKEKKFERDIVYVSDFPGIRKDLPSYSPFVLKVISYLEYNSIPYEVYTEKLGPNPRGKNPFIRYNDEFVYDSHFIIEWLSQKFNIVTKMEILDNVQDATAYIIKRFVDEAFTRLIAYNRWVDPESSKEIVPRLFTGIDNSLVRYLIQNYVQKSTAKSYKVQGVGLFTREEIYSFYKKDIESLATILGDKKYFFGDNLTVSDISIFSALCQVFFIPVQNNQFRELLLQNQNLVNYIENVKGLIFTDSRWSSLCK